MTDIARWRRAQQAEAKHESHDHGFASRSIVEKRFRDNWKVSLESVAGETVLAVGGGTGIIHTLETPRLQVSIDPLYEKKEINLEDSNAVNIIGAGEYLPFQNNSFDTVICENVIDHTHNPQKVLNKIHDVLKSNGQLLMRVNTFEAPKFIRNRLHTIDTPHPHHFSTDEIKAMLHEAEFEIVHFSSSYMYSDTNIISLAREGLKKAGGKFFRIKATNIVCTVV